MGLDHSRERRSQGPGPQPSHHVACLMEASLHTQVPRHRPSLISNSSLLLPATFLLVTPASCWLHHQSPNSSSAHLGPTWDPPWPARTPWHPCLPITLPPAQASPVLSCSKPRLQCSPYSPCPDSWANGSELSARHCFPCFPLQSEHLCDPSNKFLTFLKTRVGFFIPFKPCLTTWVPDPFLQPGENSITQEPPGLTPAPVPWVRAWAWRLDRGVNWGSAIYRLRFLEVTHPLHASVSPAVK